MKYCLFPVFFILLIACKKDAATNQPTQSFNSELKSIYYNDTIILLSTDDTMVTQHVDSFVYDNQQRLAKHYKITREVFYSGGVPLGTPIITTLNFTYNGQDAKPVSYDEGTNLHLLSYDAQGRLLKDSIAIAVPTSDVNSSRKTSFRYINDTIIQNDKAMWGTTAIAASHFSQQQQGDIVYVESYIWLNPSNPNPSQFTRNFNYGTTINPVHNMNFNATVVGANTLFNVLLPTSYHSKHLISSFTTGGNTYHSFINTNAQGKVIKFVNDGTTYHYSYN